MKNLSIRAKLLLAILGILAATLAVAGVGVSALYDRNVRSAAEDALRSAAAGYEDLERKDIEKISTALDLIVANGPVAEAFAARDREKLLAAAAPVLQVLRKEHGISEWTFIDPESKRTFLRVHAPAKAGDLIAGTGLAAAMAHQKTVAGKELGQGAFALRVARPFAIEGAFSGIIGYVELGESIDHFLGAMKRQTGDDYAIYISKKFLDELEWARVRSSQRNNWSDFRDVVVVDATTSEPMVDAAAIAGSETPGTLLAEEDRAGKLYARGIVPVKNAFGTVVGGLVVRHDISALRQGLWQNLVQALGVGLLLAAVACALVYLLVERLIFRRLKSMIGTMEDLSLRLAGGDYAIGALPPSGGDDEIGKFERFLSDFLGTVAQTLQGLAERARRGRPPAA